MHRQQQREIPGNDRRHDAHGFPHQVPDIAAHLRGTPLYEGKAVGERGIGFEGTRGPRQKGARQAPHDADLVGPEIGQSIGVHRYALANLPQKFCPLLVAHPGPRSAVERCASGAHGAVDIRLLGLRYFYEDFFRRGVDHRDL
jgi:hypothetical protein